MEIKMNRHKLRDKQIKAVQIQLNLQDKHSENSKGN